MRWCSWRRARRRADLHRRPARVRRDGTGGVLAGVTVEATSPARIGAPAVDGHRRAGPLLVSEPAARRVHAALRAGRLQDGAAREHARRGRAAPSRSTSASRWAPLEQAVTVTGEAPVVDAANAGFSTNFTQTLLQNIPTARQSYFDVVTFAPAVRINQVPNDSRFIIFGSSSDQNQFQYQRRGHLGGVQRRRLGLPEPRHHAGGAGQGDRRLGRVPQLPGRRRQHRDQVGQQRLPRDAQRLRHPRRLGGEQHAQRAVPLHRALQPAGHLRARRPRSSATACGSTGSSRPSRQATTGVGVDPNLERAGGKNYKPFVKTDRAPVRNRQPVGRLEQQHVLLRRHRQPHGAAQHPDRGARPQPGRLQPVHPDARQRHPARGPRRRHLHPRQLHALLERLRDARPHRPGHRRQLGERAERQQAVPQPHDHRRVARPHHVRRSGRARTTSRPASRRPMPRSAPSRPESAASATPISVAPSTARPTTTRRPPAAASGRWGPTCRTPGR